MGLTWQILLNYPYNLILPPHIKFKDLYHFFYGLLVLTYDFAPSTIDDADRVEWIVSLTTIIKVACIWE